MSSKRTKIFKLAFGLVLLAGALEVKAKVNGVKNENIKDMLLYLYVIPYDFNNPYLNKMIYFKNPSGNACDFSQKGKYIFSDVEGGKVNNTDIDLISPFDSFSMSEGKYLTSITKSFSSIKENYCLDVNLAPVIDLNLSGRGYYDRDKKIFYDTHLSSFVDANRINGISVTYKHYPPSDASYSKIHNDKLYKIAKRKWAKSSKELSSGYSEVWRSEMINQGDMKLKSKMDNLLNNAINTGRYDYVMLDNSLFIESNYEPYVSSSLPQKDLFLKDFKGIVITDDLYQLNTSEINIRNLFINADLFLVTSIKDFELLYVRMSKIIKEDPELFSLLQKKYNKVISLLPMK